MNIFGSGELVRNYVETGRKKSEKSVLILLLSGILAGMFVALTGSAVNTLAHTTSDAAMVKLITGTFFPFALTIVILLGLELFTSNCLISMAVLDKQSTIGKMFRNLALVYFGNLIGSLLIAGGCALFGQFDYTGGLLGAYTIKVAASKCDIPFINAVGLGIFCNILVCAAALCSFTAKDTTGRFFGALGPVAVFVFAGFEHSIANMYYIPAGLFALANPVYAEKAISLGVDVSKLTVSGLIINNLLPVTIGNIIGGCLVGMMMWKINTDKKLR